jgi:hypothetical protein
MEFEDRLGTQYRYMDVQVGSLWSFLDLPAGKPMGGSRRLFQVTVKDDPRTNMQMPGRLPAPEMFSIDRITISIGERALVTDTWEFVQCTALRFILGNKVILQHHLLTLPTIADVGAPIWTCEYCRAVYAGSTECPGCGARSVRVDLVNYSGKGGRTWYIDVGSIPVPIPYEVCFYVELETHTPVNVTKPVDGGYPMCIVVGLHGLHARVVQ